MKRKRLDALPEPMRRFCDTLRMIAYRAEIAVMPCIAEAQGNKRNPRAALRALFSTEATILPDYARKTLTVRILHLANKAHSRHLRPLLETLNETKTVFPGTDPHNGVRTCVRQRQSFRTRRTRRSCEIAHHKWYGVRKSALPRRPCETMPTARFTPRSSPPPAPFHRTGRSPDLFHFLQDSSGTCEGIFRG